MVGKLLADGNDGKLVIVEIIFRDLQNGGDDLILGRLFALHAREGM